MHTPLYFDRCFMLTSSAADGHRFMVNVTISGRCRLVEEKPEDMGAKFWLYGVNPGGIAGSGGTLDEAQRDFFDGIEQVLADLANEASSFEAFKSAVDGFVQATCEEDEAAWKADRELVRSGALKADEYRKVTAERKPRTKVEMFVKPSAEAEASENISDARPVQTTANSASALSTAA